MGAVWNPIPSFTTMVDLYQIDLDDRIVMSSSMSLVADSVLDYLGDNGIENPQYVALAYFTNAADMRIRGIGIVSNYFKARSEEHTSELQSLMRISYAVFCFTKKK